MRRSGEEAVVTAVVTALRGSSGVSAFVSDRIYNNVPQDTPYPYLVISLPTAARQDTYGRFGAWSSVEVRAVSQDRGDQEGMRILDQVSRTLDFTTPTLSEQTMLGLAYERSERYSEVINGVVTRHHVASFRAWTEQSST